MTISRVQTFNSAATAGTISGTWGASPANDSILVLAACSSQNGTGIASVTQTGAVWALATSTANGGGTFAEVWTATNLTNASTTITVTFTSISAVQGAIFCEYSGMQYKLTNNGILDRAKAGTSTSSTPTTGVSGSGRQSNQLVIAACATTLGQTASAPTGGFALVTAGSSGAIMLEQMFVNVRSTFTAGCTLSGSNAYAIAGVQIKAPGEAGIFAMYPIF